MESTTENNRQGRFIVLVRVKMCGKSTQIAIVIW